MSAHSPGRIDTWLAFWNATNRIYVNQRHRQAHYDTLFAKVGRFLPEGNEATVLDWGCGDALAADRMSKKCKAVLLYDAAEATRSRLSSRHGGEARVYVLDEAGIAELAPGTIDLIIVNSVIQYLNRAQFDELLVTAGRLLCSEGNLLLGDVIEPDTSITRDATNLLRFAWRNGFFTAALAGLLRTFVSRYRKLRRELGFARYKEDEIRRILAAHGFAVEILAENIGPSRYRKSYVARKLGGG